MNEEELKQIAEKYGFKLGKVTRFKRRDRVKIVQSNLTLTVNLRRHLEETSKEAFVTFLSLCKGEP